MAHGGNENHPRKGSSIKVGPIVDLEKVKEIKEMLSNPMHLALFTVGVNTNLRASDLVGLTFGQVRGVGVMGDLEIREKKTGKLRRVTLNGACVEALRGLDGEDGGRVFPLTVPSVHRLVKGWCRKVGLKGNFGSHTLRKTWGYHQRVTFGAGLMVLTKCFNHSSQGQTLEYLCVQPEEVRDVYANEI